jgi:hypothetical protein
MTVNDSSMESVEFPSVVRGGLIAAVVIVLLLLLLLLL